MLYQSLYKLSIGSAVEYEELIAEIYFEGKFGIIISQEKGEGIFDISIHSFDNSGENFDYTRNVDSLKIPLEALNESIDRAISELKRLSRIRET
jgi:hypothetical protein